MTAQDPVPQDSTAAELPPSTTPPEAELERRGFLAQASAAVVGAVVGIVPLITGLLFFLDPLLRKTEAGASGGSVEKDENGFIKMQITADALPADGSPQLYKVYDDVTDAWNKFLNVEIGSVWLRKNNEGEVVAFTSICPHLGCAVDFRKANQDFYCPCHTSAFDLDGNKKNQIPPRNMDGLEVTTKNGNEIWIKYENFRATIPEKKPIT